MPQYAYRCEACKKYFEVRKPMSEVDRPTECPECQSLETQRLISTVAFFTSSSGGQKRALAGVSSCSGCSVSGSGCSTCRPR
jgi:putative FmdB family regulatory protein